MSTHLASATAALASSSNVGLVRDGFGGAPPHGKAANTSEEDLDVPRPRATWAASAASRRARTAASLAADIADGRRRVAPRARQGELREE